MKRALMIFLYLLIIILFLISGILFSEKSDKVISFPDILKPGSIVIEKDRMFVTEKAAIHIYDLNNSRLLKKFGKKGEGPGEFLGVIKLHIVSGEIMVSSLGKVSYFSMDGKFIRDLRSPKTSGISGGFQPFNKGYIGTGTDMDKNEGYRTINIYNSRLQKVKEVYRSSVGSRFDSLSGKRNFFKKAFSYKTFGSRIYISGEEGFIVRVFNSNGDSLFTIKRDYKRLKFKERDKRNFLNYLKANSPDYVYRSMQKRLIFPEYYPVIFFLYADSSKIYIFTWKRSEEGLETFIYDPDGNFLGRRELPLHFMNPLLFSPFTIYKDKIYQLIEEEENEIWQLKITDIR
ncbi:MAG: hypothetical protein KAS21_11570 [Candidatus Aminicenantes bacterium]|nr:hypothetical protein [Candidatus Aminicenantes bacterium]